MWTLDPEVVIQEVLASWCELDLVAVESMADFDMPETYRSPYSLTRFDHHYSLHRHPLKGHS